jgi:hypothetical protein
VIGGVFRFYSSITGLPLDVILETFKLNDLIIDWFQFCDDALESGWTIKGLIERIETALTDVYDIQYRDEVMLKIKQHLY